MSRIVFTATADDAQGVIDPMIAQVRIINMVDDLDRRLAIRRAMRPARSAAAKRGWSVRS